MLLKLSWVLLRLLLLFFDPEVFDPELLEDLFFFRSDCAIGIARAVMRGQDVFLMVENIRQKEQTVAGLEKNRSMIKFQHKCRQCSTTAKSTSLP